MSGVAAEAVMALSAVRITLSPQQANDLYNDIYYLLGQHGVSTVETRGKLNVSALYALYDVLSETGIDGSGP